MEVNPRFWGTLQLSIAADINFPKLLCEMAVAGDVERVGAYRRELRFAHSAKGLVGNVLQRRQRRETLRELRSLLKGPAVTDLSWGDPVPELLGIPNALAGATQKVPSLS